MGEILRYAGLFLLGLGGFIVLIILYGVLIEPRFIIDTTHARAVIPNLPPEWEGRELAAIADLQVGMWWGNTGAIRKVVRQLIERPPAAVLILGDFLYHANQNTEQAIQTVQKLLAPLAQAGIPTYGLLGNHDYSVVNQSDPNMDYTRAFHLVEALEAIGIQMLDNRAELLDPGRGKQPCPFYLVGIGSSMAEDSHPEKAFAEIPGGAARFVMMHNPDSFQQISADQAPVAVAGHTHGGQIRLPGFPDWSYLSLFEQGQVHMDGWIDDFGQSGNHLYVNRGIGFSDYPIRINCPPEVTRFRLTGAKG